MGPRKREGSRNHENAVALNRGFTLIEADEDGTKRNMEAGDAPPFDVTVREQTNLAPDGADTQNEARRLAQEAVWQNARKLVKDLVEESGGNYLAVRFLFDFAGLTTVEEQQESKADFKAFMQDLLNRPKTGVAKQTSDANLNLSTSGNTHDCRS